MFSLYIRSYSSLSLPPTFTHTCTCLVLFCSFAAVTQSCSHAHTHTHIYIPATYTNTRTYTRHCALTHALFCLSQNLLFSSNSDDATVKVVDFGFARVLPEENKVLTTPCYTLAYAAPEVLSTRQDHGYTEACDLWSLGVILVSLLVLCCTNCITTGLCTLLEEHEPWTIDYRPSIMNLVYTYIHVPIKSSSHRTRSVLSPVGVSLKCHTYLCVLVRSM